MQLYLQYCQIKRSLHGLHARISRPWSSYVHFSSSLRQLLPSGLFCTAFLKLLMYIGLMPDVSLYVGFCPIPPARVLSLESAANQLCDLEKI